MINNHLKHDVKNKLAATCKAAKNIVDESGICKEIILHQLTSTIECLRLVHQNQKSLRCLIFQYVSNPEEILVMICTP